MKWVHSKSARRSLGATVGIVALLAFALPANAAFAPSAEQIVGGYQVNLNDIATDTKGNAIVVWQDRVTTAGNTLKARRVAADGTLGSAFDLSPAGEQGAGGAVAFGPGNRAFVAWRAYVDVLDPAAVKGRWVEPDGRLGPILTVRDTSGSVDAVEVDVAISATGVASVSWRDQSGTPQLGLRRVNPDGSLQNVITDVTGNNGPSEPKIAALPDGSTLAAWRGSVSQISVTSAAGVVGPPQNVSSGGLTADVGLAVDGAGNGLVTWRKTDTAPNPDTYSVRGRLLSPTGAPVGGELTIDADATRFVGVQVEPAADSDGDFLVTWNRQDAEGDSVVWARRLNSGGVFAGPAQALSDGSFSSTQQAQTLADDGTGIAIWQWQSAGTDPTQGRVLDSLAVPTTGILPIVDSSGTNLAASLPRVGYSAFAVNYPIGPGDTAIAVRRYLTPPNCSNSKAAVTEGRKTTVPLACIGVGIDGAEIVAQPKHGKVEDFSASGPAVDYTPTPGYQGSDSFSYRALTDGGSSNVTTVDLDVKKDSVVPEVKSFALVASSTGKKAGASATKRVGKKTKLSFSLVFSEAATAKVTVTKPTRGVRKGKRCVTRKPGAKGKACTLAKRVGTASSKTAADRATIAITGKLRKQLGRTGKFQATAVATDPAGNRSKPKKITFKIKRVR